MSWKLLETNRNNPLLKNEISVTDKGIYFKQEVRDLIKGDMVLVYIDQENKRIGLESSNESLYAKMITKIKKSYIVSFTQSILPNGRYKCSMVKDKIIIKLTNDANRDKTCGGEKQ